MTKPKIVLFVLALMVCALAFAGLQFAHQRGCDLVHLLRPKPSIESVMKELADAESSLGELYDQLSTLSPDEAIEQATAALDSIKSSYETLGRHDNVSTEVERRAQMISVRSYYLASKMLPPVKEAFLNQAKQVVRLRPESDDAAIARVLIFCAEHDLRESVSDNLLEDMATEARSYATKKHGVGLYSIMAHEFWKNGEAESAEKVLGSGIEEFRGTKEKMTLVNQMIDQGHRNPNESKLTQAQFAHMQRALERSFGEGTGVTYGVVVFRS